MPTYEYACTACKNRTEVVQSFSDEPLTVCEVCGGTLKRVFHPVGIVLKGSGFYATDNRSGKKALASGKDSSSSSSSSTSDTSTSSTSSTDGSGSSPSSSGPSTTPASAGGAAS